MAQGAPAHFANRAPLTGTGSRNHFRLGEWKIGTFLTACFAAIALLMIVGDAIAVLQLHRVETRAWRFYQADQKSLAIMHVYLDVVTFRDILTGLAHDQNPHEFASRATALRDNFLRDVAHAQRTLSAAPDVSQDPTILIRLGTVRAALPSQVDTLLELVKTGDWQAVRFRLAGQVPPLIGLSSSLVADVEQEVAQERARALESVQRTRRQLYLVLPITALLILLMAAMLGWHATRRISRPLAELGVGAQALARGEFGYEVDLSGKDELADLARAFNYAAQQLHKLYDDIKRSEAYLAESNTRLEEAQRITHVGYWEWDLATDCLIWSDETYRIFGLRPQERPMNVDARREMIHPGDRDRVFREKEETITSGVCYDVEHRIVRPSGEVRVLNSTRAVKKDESGRPTHFYGTVQDITDRKRAEEALQQSQFYLAEAQRLAHMGSWAFNAAGFEYWSSELFRIHGLDPSGKPPTVEEYLALVHPEDHAFMKKGITNMLADHRAFDFTKRIVRPDGEIRHVRCVGVPITQGGIFQGFLGTGMDVTEQERLTEELRLSEHYLSEGQRLAHMGSWAFNPCGFFSHWSRELLRIYGLDPAQEAPNLEEYLALIHPQDREFMRSLIKKMVTEALGCDVTKRIVRPDGEIAYIRCVGVPVVEDGTLQRIIGTAMDVTEHELLTQELRRRQAYLAEAQRLSQTGSFGWRPDSGEIVWSDETYRIFEYDRAVKPTIDLAVQRVHPDDLPEFLKVIESASAGATQFEHTYRLLLPDGSVKHVHALAHALQDASGNREFVGAATDVTSVKRAEEELRKSEAYLAEAQRLTHTGSWAWNVGTDELFWSEEIFRIYEIDPVKMKPAWSLILDRVHPDDRASLLQRKERESTGTEWADSEADFRIVVPDGKIKHLHSIAHPVMDASGQIIEVIGTVMDVTERKRVEDSLRRSESNLAEAQKLTHTGSWAWRLADRKTVHLSEEWYRIYGFDPAEGAPTWEEYFERAHPEDRLKWTGTIERAIVEKADYDQEFRILFPNGKVKWIRTVGHPVLSDAGDLEQFVGSSTDITERKSAEQEREKLRQLEADLAHTNRVSTLGEMAASLAHEIKQPIAAAITSANSCIEWLAHEPPNLDRARAAAARIDKYGNRAAEIIDRIRSFYRNSPPHRELVDVNGIVQEILTLLDGEATRSSVAMRTDLSAELPKIMVDRVQFQQVFMNLMLNAIEAMKDPGGELTVKSQLQDGQLQFSVSDTGVGLPAEKMDQIFSAFFTTKPQGSGMGLAISRSIVESHGGRLWATANGGRGATFHFTLPIQVTESSPLVA
jgi:PAS domain S-box-containing protein